MKQLKIILTGVRDTEEEYVGGDIYAIHGEQVREEYTINVPTDDEEEAMSMVTGLMLALVNQFEESGTCYMARIEEVKEV